MDTAGQIFLAGLGGVFIGMTLLYVTIRLTSLAADHLSKGGPNDK